MSTQDTNGVKPLTKLQMGRLACIILTQAAILFDPDKDSKEVSEDLTDLIKYCREYRKQIDTYGLPRT